MEFLNVLTREEMRNVKGGSMPVGGLCLYCWTPGGFESWCRTDTGSNAGSICEGIYPAYDETEVSGNWQTGGSDCSDC